MGWISRTLETIKAQSSHEPIECPRGWGQVSFVSSIWVMPPMGGLERKCPIGGVSECGECAYPSNPDAFRLAEQLAELERLRAAGDLSADEHETRRHAVVHLHVKQESESDGRGLNIAAWIMGSLGTLLAAAGTALALRVHPGFWALAGVGCVLLVLGLRFWFLTRFAWSPSSAETND